MLTFLVIWGIFGVVTFTYYAYLVVMNRELTVGDVAMLAFCLFAGPVAFAACMKAFHDEGIFRWLGSVVLWRKK